MENWTNFKIIDNAGRQTSKEREKRKGWSELQSGPIYFSFKTLARDHVGLPLSITIYNALNIQLNKL